MCIIETETHTEGARNCSVIDQWFCESQIDVMSRKDVPEVIIKRWLI